MQCKVIHTQAGEQKGEAGVKGEKREEQKLNTRKYTY